MARRYGSGTVYQLPNGKWAGQWSAGRDEYGNRLRGTVTAETEAGAWKALAAARGSSSGKRRRGGETVAAFLDRWLTDVVTVKRRERTLVGYRSIVDLHLVPAFGDRELRGLTRREVQAWVARQPGSPLSIRHRVDCLRAALSWAVKWGLIDTNPATGLDLPSVPRRTVKALRPEDAKQILAAVEGTWFAPLVTVALYTGLRQGELLGLRWEDVNLGRAGTGTLATTGAVATPAERAGRADPGSGGASLTVHHSLARLPGKHGTRYVLAEPKSGHSRRTVPLAEPAAEALRQHRRDQLASGGSWKGLVFARPDRPIDGTALTHEFQAALERAGLAPMRWHDLRHGYVSMMLAAGVPLPVVSQMAGHSGISITIDVYGHLTQETKQEATEKLARYVG